MNALFQAEAAFFSPQQQQQSQQQSAQQGSPSSGGYINLFASGNGMMGLILSAPGFSRVLFFFFLSFSRASTAFLFLCLPFVLRISAFRIGRSSRHIHFTSVSLCHSSESDMYQSNVENARFLNKKSLVRCRRQILQARYRITQLHEYLGTVRRCPIL